MSIIGPHLAATFVLQLSGLVLVDLNEQAQHVKSADETLELL